AAQSNSLCLSSPRRPPTAPLFPYTTLFRSTVAGGTAAIHKQGQAFFFLLVQGSRVSTQVFVERRFRCDQRCFIGFDGDRHVIERSEEHTSELQSRENLVCRLLLEKKKQDIP